MDKLLDVLGEIKQNNVQFYCDQSNTVSPLRYCHKHHVTHQESCWLGLKFPT